VDFRFDSDLLDWMPTPNRSADADIGAVELTRDRPASLFVPSRISDARSPDLDGAQQLSAGDLEVSSTAPMSGIGGRFCVASSEQIESNSESLSIRRFSSQVPFSRGRIEGLFGATRGHGSAF